MHSARGKERGVTILELLIALSCSALVLASGASLRGGLTRWMIKEEARSFVHQVESLHQEAIVGGISGRYSLRQEGLFDALGRQRFSFKRLKVSEGASSRGFSLAFYPSGVAQPQSVLFREITVVVSLYGLVRWYENS